MTHPVTDADLLNGYAEIAGHFGWPLHTTKMRALSGMIPTFKIGRIVCARRSTLNAWLAEREAAARKTSPAA